MKLFYLLTIALIVLFMALPVLAQESAESPEIALIPPVLLGLIAFNNRLTEGVKLYLSSPDLPYTPSAQLRSFLVSFASMIIGIGSAYVTPSATEWLGESFASYPFLAILITGISVSFGAACVELVLSLRKLLERRD